MSTDTTVDRVFNFSAGPAVLPLPVLEQAQRELLALPGCGASVLEISHRGEPFRAILESAKQGLRELLAVPANYEILFLQGGARLQFSMVPVQLLRGSRHPAGYLLTGHWGKAALAEARKEGPTQVVWDGQSSNYNRLPAPDEVQLDPQAPYLHVTSNETIGGVQFPADRDYGGVPVVCDMSSDFLSRPVEVDKYGLIYACAQKNAGPAGVTIVLIRDDLLARSSDEVAGYFNYRAHAESNSLWNTPPTFAVYVVDLVAKWLRDEVGGLENMHRRNRDQARLLYEVIDGSEGFYRPHAEPPSRSLMNVVFRTPSDELDQSFVSQAARQQLEGLKGHRSVGGIRASIYNAMPLEGVESLRDFMLDFRHRHALQ